MMAYGGVLSVLLVLLQLRLARALRFDLSGPSHKCFSEDIHSKVVVLADYRVISDNAHHTVSVKVTSPYGTVLHNAEVVQSGRFSFTTSEAGVYTACFWLPTSETGLTLHVELDWKIGVAAKDWDAVAKKDKIEGIELELIKLQDAVESIHETLLYMKEREKEMRNVNEYTNARVAWYGITSLFVCLAVAAWQLWNLRSFFERKKLL
ncbi:hypothetical protein GOP47_0023647 [Adiantum capillus-veneris]|uniref:GOLD domain-containing protein n=1 Tax=Adiantum capillus-veneris TaxID=13818 RepID=A0A9D4U4A8_ADICA|nr:hypothetical protein GOP47_0023647 [Adiantum capillus-veneris]